ncbi:Peroxygenase 1 [Sorochytrium milnesiophthora]
MPPKPVLRAITEDDLPIIRQLIYELGDFEKLSDQVTCTVEDLRHSLFTGPIRNARAVILERPLDKDEHLPDDVTSLPFHVHPHSGQLILGFCLFYFNYSTFLGKHGVYIEDIYIRAPFRSAGYGSKLMKSVFRMAVVDYGAQRVDWSVLNWNTTAIDFYKRVGAVSMSEWTGQRLTGEQLEQYRNYQM